MTASRLAYRSVAQARSLSGLRLALTANVPAPWSEAAKAIFKLRNVPYAPVEQLAMQPNEELLAWTGFRNAPVAIYEDEPPVAGWLEILLLAERLGSGASLLPDEPIDRALSLGLSCMICGPEGFGWMRRLVMSDPAATAPFSGNAAFSGIMRAYGISEATKAAAAPKLIAILQGLAKQLHRQRDTGADYFVSDRLTATDIHWACLSQMVDPLPHEECPMPEWMRANYRRNPPEILAAIDPILIEQRNFIFRRHIGLPLVF